MLKNHFIMAYSGNKRTEVDKIYNNIENIEKYNYIIEPFCGSSALSFYISLKHPKKYKYVLNDNNNFLIDLYKIFQDETKTNIFLDEMKTIIDNCKDKTKYLEYVKQSNKCLKSWYLVNTFYRMRPGLYDCDMNSNRLEKIKKAPIINFLRNEKIILLNKDYKDVYEDYKNIEDCLIFLDPPYISSCNNFYKNPDVNIYEYLYNNNINNEKSKIILCLESIWIIKLLFKSNKFIEYAKQYEISKKKTTHCLIMN